MSRRPQPNRGTSLLLITILAVITAVLLIVFVLQLARRPGGKVNLGDQVFQPGPARTIAPLITKRGPIFFRALRGDLDIYLQHLGTDPGHGWLAFSAHVAGQPRSCVLRWVAAARDFSDSCRGPTYPADGGGLDQYLVQVTAGSQLDINLRQTIGTVPPQQ